MENIFGIFEANVWIYEMISNKTFAWGSLQDTIFGDIRKRYDSIWIYSKEQMLKSFLDIGGQD